MPDADTHEAMRAASLEPPTPLPSRRPSRSLLIAAWATGPAALYALASLAHALLVQRNLTVDIGFGRSLAFWVVSVYLALLLWGFLPREPNARFLRPGVVYGLLGIGGVGLLVCGGYTVAWLVARWETRVALPVLGALVAMVAAGVATLRVADHTERDGDDEPRVA